MKWIASRARPRGNLYPPLFEIHKQGTGSSSRTGQFLLPFGGTTPSTAFPHRRQSTIVEEFGDQPGDGDKKRCLETFEVFSAYNWGVRPEEALEPERNAAPT